MPKLFREDPPLSFIKELLQTCGLHSIQDSSWFQKNQIELQQFEELLPELEPFYIPCKAQEYLYTSLTQARIITILRQVLRVHNLTIVSKEKTYGSEKQLWYQLQQLQSTSTPLTEEISISFT
jgi:hypothetical protein